MTWKIVSLNVEGDRHLDRQRAFLRTADCDLIGLQEVLFTDYETHRTDLRMDGLFEPMCKVTRRDGTWDMLGVAILTRLPFHSPHRHYYRGDGQPLARFKPRVTAQSVIKRALLAITVNDGKAPPFTFATTHFTWTGDGRANDEQREDVAKLMTLLAPHQRLVLCGDFNAPRGGEIFNQIAARYTDHIPPHVSSSIDAGHHYAGDLDIMIDGLFTTPHFDAGHVDLVADVSDHLAVSATLAESCRL